MRLKYLYLFPIGDVDSSVLAVLQDVLEEKFGFPCKIGPALPDPRYAYNPERGQYKSTMILGKVRQALPQDALKGLGVTSVDLYVPMLNFIFGEAEVRGRCAVISLCRLKPKFYGVSRPRLVGSGQAHLPNGQAGEDILKTRAIKEAVHELGHTFGLSHCSDPKCVMCFSNSLMDTDFKEENFCSSCQNAITLSIQNLLR
ncbi:MAG: archaemetzincin family Zn-dependent metalloprotease [Actinomycetota bacterium]|nr:archaemetzincin family Zn-dependent metalloprotease [Actinomycetota bacterium]MDI6821856.1 archaemetzincin family Zn-dependent metalloprotease [Actinomycetota bacterium]